MKREVRDEEPGVALLSYRVPTARYFVEVALILFVYSLLFVADLSMEHDVHDALRTATWITFSMLIMTYIAYLIRLTLPVGGLDCYESGITFITVAGSRLRNIPWSSVAALSGRSVLLGGTILNTTDGPKYDLHLLPAGVVRHLALLVREKADAKISGL